MEKIKQLLSKYDKVILVLIILIQLCFFVFSASQRKWLHMDELLSLGLMQYKNAFLYMNDDFYDNVHDSEYFMDYITVSENEKFDFIAPYKNQINDVHPPLYYFLLKASYIFGTEHFTIWPGIVLNLILFVIEQIILYFIGLEIFKNKKYALVLCILNGLSIATIEMVTFLRMYQLLITICLALLLWHLKFYKREILDIKHCIALAIIIILGCLTHYYFAIFEFLLLLLMIFYCKGKSIKRKVLFKYIITVLISVLIFIMIFPFAFMHLLNRNVYVSDISTVGNAPMKFINSLKIGWKLFIKVFNNEALNGLMVYIIAIVFILFLLSFIIRKNKNIAEKHSNTNNLRYFIVFILLYYLIITIVSKFVVIRYLYPIVPLVLIVIVYLLRMFIDEIFNKKLLTFAIIICLVIVYSVNGFGSLSNNLYTYNGVDIMIRLFNEEYKDLPLICFLPKYKERDNKIMNIFFLFDNREKIYIESENDKQDVKNYLVELDNIVKNNNMDNDYILVIHEDFIDEFNKQIESKLDARYIFNYHTYNVFIVKNNK